MEDWVWWLSQDYAFGRWGMVHKAFKVSLDYIMRSSLTDNKK